MTIFLVLWFSTGFVYWLKHFIEFFNIAMCRPGIIECFFCLLAGPIPLIFQALGE